MNMELFLDITLFLLENNFCIFRGEYYLQIFECAMGSKLSPILAQYVVDHLVKSCINKLPFRILFLKKFVDDILTSIPKEETLTILNCFNSYSSNLQFTLEVEDYKLVYPFQLQRHRDEIRFKWHRKETNSNKMEHLNSNQNINVIKQMKLIVSQICHRSYEKEAINMLFEMFRQNGYPDEILKKLLFAADITDNQPRKDDNMEKETRYASFPNINRLTQKLKSIFHQGNVTT